MGVFLRRAFLAIAISLLIAAGAIDFRDIVAVLFGDAVGSAGSGPPPTAMSVPAPSLRIATFNAYQLSWLFLCHNALALDCLAQTSGQTEQWANHLADTILANAANIDVLALNEIWDEGAKAILVKRLSPTFPIFVEKIDSSLVPLRAEQFSNLWHRQIAGEDSGLMLFAKADYKVVPLPRTDFKWGNALEGKFLIATTSEVAFTLFDSCSSADCGAAKGAALIRLQNRMGGPIYDVVFTHTQADYDDEPSHADARAGQFRQIRQLIETTLAPLGDHVAADEAVIMLGDLNVPFLKFKTPSEWNSYFMRPGSFFTAPMREVWSTSSSLDDRYMSNSIDRERYDHILVSAPGPGMSDFKPRCVQHLTIPVDFQNLESDHFLLLADINADFLLCNPMLAKEIDLRGIAKTLSVSTDGAGAPVARLNTPGAMQWFKVTSGGSGTYDISLTNTGPAMFVRMDIYAPDDLTTPVSRYNKTAVVDHTGLGNRQSSSTSELYPMPGDFFIRVSGVTRGDFGNYVLNVKLRDCSSKQSACVLQPGAPAQPASLSPSTLPNPTQAQNDAWYRFDVSGKPDGGARQSITLTASLADTGRVSARLDDFSDPTGPRLVKSNAGAVSTFAGAAGNKASGYLVISQSSAAGAPTPVSAAMDTDLRLFEFSNLTCKDETDPEFGSDDIYTQFDIDGQTLRAPSSGEVEFDCDGSPDPEFWPNHFGRNTIAFSNHLLIRVAEGDDTSDDDLSPWFAPVSLDPNAVEAHNLFLLWNFAGGTYQLDYGLRRRANAPVADP